MRAPNSLPAWSRGHVVTHLGRNADAIANMVRSALDGESRPTHHSPEFRDDAISAGAGRFAADLLTDLRTSTAALAELLIQLGSGPIAGTSTCGFATATSCRAESSAGCCDSRLRCIGLTCC